MLFRPTDLADDRQADVEDFAASVHERMLGEVEAMLEGFDPEVAQLAYDVAFSPNDALPRSEHRPQLRPAVLAVAVAEAYDLDEDTTDALLGFTVASQEYFDVLDDFVDGDVAPDREREVFLVTQLLLAMTLRRLGALGADAVTYWADRLASLTAAPLAEGREERSAEAFERVLDRQTLVLGSVTGVAGVVAGRDEDGIDRAERLGRLVYRHFALVHDAEQYVDGADADEDWNAAAVFAPADLVDRLDEARSDVDDATRSLPEPVGRRIRSLVALDVETWRREVFEA